MHGKARARRGVSPLGTARLAHEHVPAVAKRHDPDRVLVHCVQGTRARDRETHCLPTVVGLGEAHQRAAEEDHVSALACAPHNARLKERSDCTVRQVDGAGDERCSW